jgi:hypothetical protein
MPRSPNRRIGQFANAPGGIMPEFGGSVPQLITRVSDALLLDSGRREHSRHQRARDQSEDTDEPRVAMHSLRDLIPRAPGQIASIAGAIEGSDAGFAHRPNGSPCSACCVVNPTVASVILGPGHRFAVGAENLPRLRHVIARPEGAADPDIVCDFAHPASRRLYALVLCEAIRQSGVIGGQPSDTYADQCERKAIRLNNFANAAAFPPFCGHITSL